MKRRFFAMVVAVLFVVLPAKDVIRASTSSYTVEDLGIFEGLVPTITGMNASGQVSGWIRSGTIRRAVRYTNDIGWQAIPGLHATNSTATAINARGDVAGFHGTPSRPFRYTDAGGVTTLDVLPGGSFAMGLAINAAGVMTGNGDSSSGLQRSWRSVPGEPSEIYPELLPTLGGTVAMACGVNDQGQIAGSATNAAGQQHAYRVDPRADGSGFDVTEAIPLDGPAGLGRACAINASGRFGGNSSDNGVTRAFVSDGGPSVNLDTFGSAQSTVESMSGGISVGWYVGAAGARAFVHTDANGSADLNTLLTPGTGWVLQQAFAVNAVGQIAGVGTLNGVRRAFRLTPTAPPPDTIAPVISAVSATPSSIAPPKGQLVDVTVDVTASDDVDAAPVCAVSSISATGGTADDYSFTGLTARVRAVGDRTYTLSVTCADAAGNVSAASSTDVVVPPDTSAPVITAVSATPSSIEPPKGQLVDVAVAVTATDNVDDAPVCAVSSISGGGTADDYSFTGLTARVRAVGGRTYTLSVTCADAAGNVSPASSTDVVVPPDTTAPVISAVSATPSSIAPPKGQLVDVTVAVTATDNVDDAPVCAVSSISATGGTADDYTFTGLTARVRAVGGRTYTLSVTCADALGNVSPASATSVVVPPDTTAPVISAVSATPSSLAPPKGQLVDVAVTVTATDDVDDAPVCAVSSISATGSTADDYSYTGLTARLRAVSGRTYTLYVTCTDAAGNVSPASSTTVVVPPDTIAPVIWSIHATPDAIWPPNGKLVSVTLTVSATDNVDGLAQCSLTSVTSNGGAAGDAAVTGQFTADVRADKNGDGTVRVYNLNVTCHDRAHNKAMGTATVFVGKDHGDVEAYRRGKSKR